MAENCNRKKKGGEQIEHATGDVTAAEFLFRYWNHQNGVTDQHDLVIVQDTRRKKKGHELYMIIGVYTLVPKETRRTSLIEELTTTRAK